jgi:putative oxidoreductase
MMQAKFKKVLTCDCAGMYNDLAYAVLRVALGVIFVYHGYDKVFTKGVEGIAGFLGSLGFPLPMLMSYILSYGELIAGLMLIAGAFTHWASKYALVVGIVAWVTVHLANGFSAQTGGYEFIMLITAVSLAVMAFGPGKYSMDKTILADMHTHN